MRISDWSSDVCSSDLLGVLGVAGGVADRRILRRRQRRAEMIVVDLLQRAGAHRLPVPHVDEGAVCGVMQPALVGAAGTPVQRLRPQVRAVQRRQMRVARQHRSEEHTSELQSLMRISYAVFCLKKKKTKQKTT